MYEYLSSRMPVNNRIPFFDYLQKNRLINNLLIKIRNTENCQDPTLNRVLIQLFLKSCSLIPTKNTFIGSLSEIGGYALVLLNSLVTPAPPLYLHKYIRALYIRRQIRRTVDNWKTLYLMGRVDTKVLFKETLHTFGSPPDQLGHTRT